MVVPGCCPTQRPGATEGDVAMKTIHLRVSSLDSKKGSKQVESILSKLVGVVRIAAVCSIGLVSVMYDETRATAEQIVAVIRAEGFEAWPCQPAFGAS
jgi:hypothetical protein